MAGVDTTETTFVDPDAEAVAAAGIDTSTIGAETEIAKPTDADAILTQVQAAATETTKPRHDGHHSGAGEGHVERTIKANMHKRNLRIG